MSTLPVVPIRHAVHRLIDPDEFSVAISGGMLVADFLAKQENPTRIEQFQTAAWTLDIQQANVKAHVHCPLPGDWASVGLMRGPSVSSWYGYEGAEGMLMCNPPGEAIDGCFAPGFDCVTVSVPAAMWERCARLAGGVPGEFNKVAAIHLPPAVRGHIERRLRGVMPLLRCSLGQPGLSAFVAREVTDLVTGVITTAWELSAKVVVTPASHRNRTRLAHRAVEWMRAHLGNAMQVPDVCLALGVSRRELEYAFRQTFDQSPRDFFQAMRLNAIRRFLLRAGPGVSLMDVAFDHGVMHLGRFAESYRALFGENPSVSRKGRRTGIPIAAARRDTADRRGRTG